MYKYKKCWEKEKHEFQNNSLLEFVKKRTPKSKYVNVCSGTKMRVFWLDEKYGRKYDPFL